jgi:IMP dehydrogenase/GMP reductase
MKIDTDIKLDFSDVLLIPKSSELNSRSEVDVEREFTFKYSQFKWKGVPIIVSNMDTTGTVEMARQLQKFKVITCLHKYHKAEDIPVDLDRNFYAVSTGIQDSDLENLDKIVQKCNPNFICVDVANGYAKRFLEVVKKLREKYPTKTLIGGNVVTRDLVEQLVLYGGLDIVKVGIGSGCFSADTRVLMANGAYKNINNIQIGDKVINMNGEPVTVTNVMNQGVKNTVKFIKYNDTHKFETIVTPDHKFWIYNSYTNNYEWCELRFLKNGMYVSSLDEVSKDYEYKLEENGYHEVFDIEVDCPTHSFIANNSIVHNSVCTTRLQTGIGYPQFSAILECADAAHGLDAHIISDGGIQNVGDFSKAFGAGADFVMCGSMFAGHEECNGETIEENGKKYKIFYGMSSAAAMNKYHGGVAHYRSAEGKIVKIPYKGKVDDTILNILGGIRSTMTYINARKIKNIPKCATFIRVNNIVNKIYNGSEI